MDVESLIFVQYHDRLMRLRREPGSLKNVRIALGHFDEYITAEGIAADAVKPWVIEEFLASAQIAATTQRSWHAIIRAAYRYAHARGVVDHVPTAGVQFERPPDREPHIFSGDELRAMKARCITWQQLTCFFLFAYTGLRKEEGRVLEWKDVKLADETLTVVGKGGKLRHVPIHPVLGEFLVGHPHDGRTVLAGKRSGLALAHGSMYNLLYSFAPLAGFHDFRRTVSSSLFANDVQTDVIDAILGWAPRTVRSRYYQRIAPIKLQRAILKLYSDDPLDCISSAASRS